LSNVHVYVVLQHAVGVLVAVLKHQWEGCCSGAAVVMDYSYYILVGIWSAHTKWDNLASETMAQMLCKDNP